MNLGSVSEVIAHNKTGLVCQIYEEMAAMIPAALEIDRRTCRSYVEANFTITQMVDGYEAAYRQVLERRFSMNGRLHTPMPVYP
jgi:purine nucleoside phosphorylase